MIIPKQKDEALLADIDSVNDADLHIWWLGQSGFLVKHAETTFLFDPYLSDTLTKKYAKTDKPHVRMTEQVIAPESLGFVPIATSSHVHTDHLDHGTLLPLREANPSLKLILPRAIKEAAIERLGDWGDDFLWVNAGDTIEDAGIRFKIIPAAHNTLKKDDAGNHHFIGFVAEIGPWRIYHSGDTLLYDGIEEWIGGPVDVAILPINGNKPERRVAGNLDGKEAAYLAKRIGAQVVIPCHFEMFEFNTATPDLFETSCRELEQNFYVMQAGERLSLPSPVSAR
ncbi:MAG: MBL fold metallo-hydrolase [Verrucomicrobiota bacterium]